MVLTTIKRILVNSRTTNATTSKRINTMYMVLGNDKQIHKAVKCWKCGCSKYIEKKCHVKLISTQNPKRLLLQEPSF
jgi:hypothetical protein